LGGVPWSNLHAQLGDGVGGAVEVLEKVIGPPLYDVLHVTQLTRSLVLAAVLDHAPAQHGHGEGHGEVEFYGVAGVVVTAHQILNDGRHAVTLAVLQPGVASPGNIVVARELSGFLGVEEEEGLVEGDGVVVGRGWLVVVAGDGFDDEGDEAGEEGADGESAECPDEELAADDDAAKIYVPFLLLFLFSGAQEPALLCLV